MAIQARSLKVTYFGVSGKPTKDHISLYNSVGLITRDSKAIATENTKITVFDLSFDAPSPGNPVNIRINLILPETKVTGLHFCR